MLFVDSFHTGCLQGQPHNLLTKFTFSQSKRILAFLALISLFSGTQLRRGEATGGFDAGEGLPGEVAAAVEVSSSTVT